MANIKSSKKRVKVIAKKTLENKSKRTQVSTIIKKFKSAILSNNAVEAEALLPEVYSVIDSAASDGILHKNNAANKKSALAKTLSDLKSGKLVIAAKVDNKTRIAEKRAREEAARAEQKQRIAEAKAIKDAEKAAAGKKPAKKAAAKDVKPAKATKAEAEVKPVKKAAPKAKKEAKTEEAKSE